MALTQNQRDKIAISTVLKEMVEATFPDIALRAGEGLGSPLMEMVQAGDVIRTQVEGKPTLYRLKGEQ